MRELHRLLVITKYNEKKTSFLIKGFQEGFDLGYRSDEKVQLKSNNLKFFVGDKKDMWQKIMAEVKEKRYAGPYQDIPKQFKDDFIQSPIGLVPKDGNKTRLIFHLSHPRGTGLSVNENTDKQRTKVEYQDFDEAIRLCIKAGIGACLGKSDLSAAFRQLPIHKSFWRYLIMKAQSPLDNKFYYFVDKCLPFGASISCALFQEFSDALSHIVQYYTKKENINYLDDFLFAAKLKEYCDWQLKIFLQVCSRINLPVSVNKTVWGKRIITFLGLTIDTIAQKIWIPRDKIDRAKMEIEEVLGRKKIRLKRLQHLCGFLNFIGKCVVPGRAFTRRIYSFGESILKQHHHLDVKEELKLDLKAWKLFLDDPQMCSRPFFHLDKGTDSDEVFFYTDASRNSNFGCGGVCGTSYYIMQWEEDLIEDYNPSINFLELYALTVGFMLWGERFRNRKITVFCDNQSVLHMVNNNSSKCKRSMLLIRLLIIHAMKCNVKLSVKYVESKRNAYADYLSRMKYGSFRKLARQEQRVFEKFNTPVPDVLLPVHKFCI